MFIGIDPGDTGSICYLGSMNIIFTDTSEIADIGDMEPIQGLGIEKQTALARQKGAGKTMMNYGILLGHLQAYDLEYDEIRPHEWYQFYGMKSGLEYKVRKKTTAAMMEELYPDSKHLFYGPRGGLLDGRTDTLAIAHYMKNR